MPPAQSSKLVRADTSPTMTSTSSSEGNVPPPPKDYYNAGSVETVKETKLTVSRLETRRKLTKTSDRLVLVLVGLPARGKSFISRKLLHYVNWTGVRCKAFNVGKYRREAYAEVQASMHTSSEATKTDSSSAGACDANFFAAENAEAAALRQRVAQIALDDMLAWLDEEDEDYWDEAPGVIDASRHSCTSGSTTSMRNGRHHAAYQKVAIFDATNSTVKRRQWILEQCTSPDKRGDKKTGVVFVESLCADQELLDENYRFKVSNSPDYKDMTVEEGMADLLKRVRNYEEQYETIDDDKISYIKVYDLSTKIMVNHIYGRLAKDLVPALMAWHIGSRPVFLCRPGRTLSGTQSEDGDTLYSSFNAGAGHHRSSSNLSATWKKRRGDTLCPEGIGFRKSLWEFLRSHVREFVMKRRSVMDNKSTGTSISGLQNPYQRKGKSAEEIEEMEAMAGPLPVRILASTMPRGVETVSFEEHDVPFSTMSNLNPIDKGDYAGMEMEDIKAEDPLFFSQLQADPFSTRFPGGESYHDLVRRLAPVVIDVEQQVVPVVVVSHVSILQCLMAYFRNTPVKTCMTTEVPMHTVIKFEPARGGGWKESWHQLEAEPSSPSAKKGIVAVPSSSEFSTLSVEHDASQHDGSQNGDPIWWGETISNHRMSPKFVRRQMTT